MEEKDTVMTDKQIERTILSASLPESGSYAKEICIKQAEISFKAGKEVGIKEVVEWIQDNADLERGDRDVGLCFEDYLHFDYRNWQAKLKSWHISA